MSANEGETAGWAYKPEEEFEQDSRHPLVDLDLSESSQLWLFQWPLNELPDIHGKEISLNLVDSGHLGNFEGSSGESFDVVSVAGQEPDATVFLSSPSGTKIVGEIARRVSIAHYPDPEKLEERETKKLSKRKMQQTPFRSSSATPTRSSKHTNLSATPTRSSKHTNSSLSRERSSKMHSSRTKNISQPGEQSKSAKRERVREPSGATDRSTISTKSSKLSR